jgi:hypothetical protein
MPDVPRLGRYRGPFLPARLGTGRITLEEVS